MLSNRFFTVFIGEEKSKIKMLNNGLPQGSVLAPLLFNLYIKDLPATTAKIFIYADDLALACQSKEFEDLENILSEDLDTLHIRSTINGDSNPIHQKRKSPSSI